MHRYELSYDHMTQPKTKTGEEPERIDAHELVLKVIGLGGKGGQIIGTSSLQESLELMRITNVKVEWL